MPHLFRRSKSRWSPAPLAEHTDAIRNPERGMYRIVRFDAASARTPEGLSAEDVALPKEQSLVLAELNLQAFSEAPLSTEALTHIDRILTALEARGMDLILRFLYDWDGQGFDAEPSELSLILTHMDQLSPLLHAHGNHIFTVQGLFTGSWGEMHHTRYASAYSMKCLYDRLAEATAPQTFLAVRCPNLWRSIFRTFSPAVRAGGSPCRLGLFNDAITASETDMGTYGDCAQAGALRWEEKFRRDDELLFQQTLCRQVPNGGEVLVPGPYNDLPAAIATFRSMHLTYLNSAYDPAVLEKWKHTTVQLPGSVWHLQDGCSYIAAHLGYRYLIRRCSVRFPKGNIQLTLSVENTGFAPCYREVQAFVILTSATGESSLQLPLSADVRSWMPGSRQTIGLTFSGATLAPGSYRVSLSLRSAATGRSLRFANTVHAPEGAPENWIGDLLIC